MTLSRDEKLALLKEFGALKEGHFVLASGKHSGHYVQVAMITQYPTALARLIEGAIADLKKRLSFTTMFTPAIGGVPVAQTAAQLADCRIIFAERNSENKMELRRGFTLAKGERIVLVEDVVTTGGTLVELKAIAEQAGAEIAGVFTVINRSGKETWQGFPLEAAIAIDFPTYEEKDCPLCKQGIPAYRPGTKKVGK